MAQSYGVLMNYLKNFFHHFLIVFFVNYTMPGIVVIQQTKWPHIGSDLIFPLVLGFLNSLIYPVLKVVDQKITPSRIGVVAAVLSFVSYAILKFTRFGLDVKSVEGFLFAAGSVALCSFFLNYFEMKSSIKFPKPPDAPHV